MHKSFKTLGCLTAVTAFTVALPATALLTSANAETASSTTSVSAERTVVAGPLTAFPDPFLDGTPNPVTGGNATVKTVVTPAGSQQYVLQLKNVAPNTMFHSHVHVTTCEDNKGSGHYRNVAELGGAESNEVWLDLNTDAEGNAGDSASRNWVIRPGEAKSVVIHGHSGQKLGCINVGF